MHLKAPFALAIAALVLAGCGAAPTSPLPPAKAAASAASAPARPAILWPGHPHVFHSRTYLAQHPDVERRLHGKAPHAGGNLQYGGGPVQVAPAIYLVFWGFSGPSDVTHDPYGLAAYMTGFFSAIPGSTWLNTDTQYYQTSGGTAYVGNPSTQYAGAYYDPAPPPSAKYTDAQVAAEAVKAAGTLGFNGDGNYIVITPTGYKESGFGNNWCGYHSDVRTAGGLLAYTDLPYTPDAGQGCGANSVTSPGNLDGASIVGGHEESETQTDPDGNAWGDAQGNEIGDKCAWLHLADTAFPNGGSYPTQPLWSNASASCVQSYGTVTPGSPTPSPVPSTSPSASPTPAPGPNLLRNAGFETGKMAPWRTCANNSARAAVTTQDPQSGAFDAYAGVRSGMPMENGITSICQLVRVPRNGTVSVWTAGVGNDTSRNVFQFGALYKTNGHLDKVLYITNLHDGAWRQRTYSVAGLAGHLDYLVFGVVESRKDAGKAIGQFVDSVTLAGTGAAVSETVPAPMPAAFDLPR